MRASFFILPLALLLAGVANAADLTVAVETKLEINATKEQVWNVLKKFEDLSWFAGVTKTEVSKETETMIGSERLVTLAAGAVLKEVIVDWREQDSLSYMIYNLPFKRYFIEINLEANGPLKTLVQINGYGQVIPEGMRAMGFTEKAAFTAFIQDGVYGQSLKNLKALLETDRCN